MGTPARVLKIVAEKIPGRRVVVPPCVRGTTPADPFLGSERLETGKLAQKMTARRELPVELRSADRRGAYPHTIAASPLSAILVNKLFGMRGFRPQFVRFERAMRSSMGLRPANPSSVLCQ